MNDVYENVSATDQVGLCEWIVGGVGDFADNDSWSPSPGWPLNQTRRTVMGLVTDGLIKLRHR
jgi:hypothetical protein